jgi:Flp pilus assembly protein CpaB
MQSKTPLLMVTALVCGLGAAFGTWKLVSGAQAAPVEDSMVKVLVPVGDIPSYHLFADRNKFQEKDWPKSKLRETLEDTVTNFDMIKGKTSRHYKLRAGEPVYRNDICDTIENDISDRLKAGEEAMGIPVAPEDGSGFIHVGDRVDIAASISASQGEPAKTQYILEAIEVLAVDSNAQKTEMAAGNVTPPSRFLLRVTRQQALVLQFFKDNARLRVFKRKLDDPTILGDGYVFSMGKKASSAQRYIEESAEPTMAVPLQEVKLADPTDSDTKPTVARVINGEKPEGPGWDKVTSTAPHSVKLNDGNGERVIQTKERITRESYVEKKKDDGKKDGKDDKATEKQGEKKDGSGN